MVSEQVLIAIAGLLGVMIVSMTMLRGWQGWLMLKERELDRGRHEIEGGAGSGMQRIELADLKERIRKLEAIASGVDL
ncbi:MAG: hypothetical protein P0Y56_14375 [Candidatus Andeanibacterium colombiense]|uniref:Phage shock protein B n=1 Tax=Candidatus Andeanibacterium colombiense TaxID=3121345 RepID=A0AAJ5X5Y9_9SPHN|nr:MAG: hypothetical protein P0Y56_14375 [Sphingomonadaceae bacterium]